jgi:hypothetical protein
MKGTILTAKNQRVLSFWLNFWCIKDNNHICGVMVKHARLECGRSWDIWFISQTFLFYCISKHLLKIFGYSATFLAHLAFRPCELLSSLFIRRPSVNISHFNLLLRYHWANCNQTLVEWSLDGPLPKMCPVIPTSNQDGRQAQNRKKGGKKF